jgi:hypothetical protein
MKAGCTWAFQFDAAMRIDAYHCVEISDSISILFDDKVSNTELIKNPVWDRWAPWLIFPIGVQLRSDIRPFSLLQSRSLLSLFLNYPTATFHFQWWTWQLCQRNAIRDRRNLVVPLSLCSAQIVMVSLIDMRALCVSGQFEFPLLDRGELRFALRSNTNDFWMDFTRLFW